MEDLAEIRAKSITEQVYTILQRQIVSGHLQPGARILEKDLALRLGVSRTPIREALLKLEMAGIVVCNSRRSYNVRVLTTTDVKEIFEILGILEGAVVNAVAKTITSSDLDLLKEYNQRMAGLVDGGDFHTFGEWNEKFHDVFISKYPNRSLREFCDSVRRLLYTFPVRQDSLRQWIGLAAAEHNEIIRLAAAKDGIALETFIRNVHWNHHHHSPYIEDAYAGEIHCSSPSEAREEDSATESELQRSR